MTVELGVEIAVLALAAWAAWVSIPRPPALDWERLFKTVLATVIRGEVENEKGDSQAWETRLRREVPYHPAARDLERWLSGADLGAIRSPAVDGERALVSALGLLSDPVERYRHACGGDPRGLDALMADPAWLGEDYDPGRALGPDLSWDSIAAWDEGVQKALLRRLSHVVFLGLGDRDWEALCPVPGVKTVALVDADPESVEAALKEALQQPSDRVIMGLAEGNSDVALQTMIASAAVRDRVLGVIAFGVDLRTEWALKELSHRSMEPELQRCIPFFSVVDVDPDAPLARSWEAQRFWEPQVPEGGRRSIEAIDLGGLPLGELSPRLLSRAIWTTVAFRLAQGV